MGLPEIILIIACAAIVAGVAVTAYVNKKKGKSSCDCGCDCSHCNACKNVRDKKEK